jgi:hypothetical protein
MDTSRVRFIVSVFLVPLLVGLLGLVLGRPQLITGSAAASVGLGVGTIGYTLYMMLKAR